MTQPNSTALNDHVHPGDTCPTCARRIPYPKQPTSPVTRVSAYRVPVDDADTHNEAMQAWAEHWGLLGKPHWKFWLLSYAAAEALAGPPRDVSGE